MSDDWICDAELVKAARDDLADAVIPAAAKGEPAIVARLKGDRGLPTTDRAAETIARSSRQGLDANDIAVALTLAGDPGPNGQGWSQEEVKDELDIQAEEVYLMEQDYEQR